MPRVIDQAICLRETEWSETSQLVTLITRSHGKVRGVAKGSRRTSPGSVARYSGGIDALTGGELVYTLKRGADLATITEWDLQQPWPGVRRNYRAMCWGLYAAEAAGAMVAEQDEHAEVYEAMGRLLDTLGGGERSDGPGERAMAVAMLVFQWSLLKACGYEPELHQDALGGGELGDSETYCFDPRGGGLTQRSAPVSNGGGWLEEAGPWRVRRETVAVLRAVEAGDGAAVSAADAATLERANRLLCVYSRSVLDRELPTLKWAMR